MSWRVRHEGSPESVERTLPELEAGLADGVWETTDEVQEPGASAWVAFESHPHFAEMCEELEAPAKPAAEGEAHLDMNALIDVTMVLLIFFILTTTMAALQRRIEAPSASNRKAGIAKITEKEVAETAILVKAEMQNGQVVVSLEGRPVALDDLQGELLKLKRSSKRSTLLLQHDDKVTMKSTVPIIDKARGAGLDQVRLVVPDPAKK